MQTAFNKKRVIYIGSFLLYMIIAYSYAQIHSQYQKELLQTKEKIVGVEYLKLLHTMSLLVLQKGKEAQTQTLLRNIESFLKEHPKYQNKKVLKHLNFFRTYNQNYKSTDIYNFLDFINREDYRVGDISGIMFSQEKEKYYFGILLIHYLPEFSVSVGILKYLYQDFLQDGQLSQENQLAFIQHHKLVHLSMVEVSDILDLLTPKSRVKFKDLITQLKSISKDTIAYKSMNAIPKKEMKEIDELYVISEKLNDFDRSFLHDALVKKKLSLENTIFEYNLITFFIFVSISLLFLYTFYLLKVTSKQKYQMFQQSRLAQMGEMISMIAHQWRQPLHAISTTAASMKFSIELENYNLDTQEGREEQKEYFLKKLMNIEEYLQSLTTTIDDFRNFYKPNKKRQETNLQVVCEKALKIIQSALLADGIQIENNYHSSSNSLMHDNEMVQVLLNIFKNAQDNFKEKQIQNPSIVIHTQAYSISICDNGGGISPEVLSKIFDPYFSSKNEKNGTGLGLYMSKIIVEEHHQGKLLVYNTEDGVCFKIELKNKLGNDNE